VSRSLSRLLVIAGPTATGKSEVGLAVAEATDGEIVNADAMQLYRGMDIGTAKLPAQYRQGIPHHLLDVLEVTQPATVASYQRDARAAVEDVLRRGRTPILVGGSGLYLQAVADDLSFPATDPAVRADLERALAERGAVALHRDLAAVDPEAAGVVDPRDGRRIVRALEVVAVTGRPFRASMPMRGALRYDAAWVCLDRDTAELDARIDRRVHQMIDLGLLHEVDQLAARGLRTGPTASRALGYRQLLDVLDGVSTLRAAVDSTISGTRRLVRRQRSWFRRDDRQVWLDADAPDVVAQILRVAQA